MKEEGVVMGTSMMQSYQMGTWSLTAHALLALKPHPGDAGFFIRINCYQTFNVQPSLITSKFHLSFMIDALLA